MHGWVSNVFLTKRVKRLTGARRIMMPDGTHSQGRARCLWPRAVVTLVGSGNAAPAKAAGAKASQPNQLASLAARFSSFARLRWD